MTRLALCKRNTVNWQSFTQWRPRHSSPALSGGKKKFTPAPFHTGSFSIPLAWADVTFPFSGVILAMFPTLVPIPTTDSMNYTPVVNMAAGGGASL
jgi:hypothetical protein